MTKKFIRILKVLIIFILCFSMSLSANATTVSEIKKQQADTQKQLDAANDEIESLNDVRKGITEEIQQIDDELVELMASISILEDEIDDIEAEIEVKKVELADAEEVMTEQYEAMKSRIKFMYEKGDYTYMQLLFEAESMGDVINKADYIEELYTYDRQKLQEFIEAKEAVEVAKANLEEEQDELEVTHFELEEEKQDLDAALAQKKEEAEDYDNQIARAKQEAAAYKAQIKQQNNQIKKLEEEAKKKAEEEAKKKAEAEAKKKAEAEAKKKAEEEAKKKAETTEKSDTTAKADTTSSTNTTDKSDTAKTDAADKSETAKADTTAKADATAGTDTAATQTGTDQTAETNTDTAETPVEVVSEPESEPEQSSAATSSTYSKGQEVANFACQFIGNPYVSGGTSLTEGADCSGFTMSVYKNFGYSLPRSSSSQRSAGVGVTYAEAQPGDIICYAGHVAIYIGNGQIVHASTPSSGIKIGNATYREILAVRRIVQ